MADILKDVEARFGVEVAIEVLDRIGGAFELIAGAPQIAYQVGGGGVEILFVERGEKDWAELTEER